MRVPPLSVYDGRTHIGALDDRGPGEVVAYVIDAAGRRRKLGTYATRKEGVGAIAAKTAGRIAADGERASAEPVKIAAEGRERSAMKPIRS